MDYEEFKTELKDFEDWSSKIDSVSPPYGEPDMVNSPAHYTRGRVEVIDSIEDAIQDAPDPILGSIHANILRYTLRLWLKDTPLRNAKKAKWYLERLISKLED